MDQFEKMKREYDLKRKNYEEQEEVLRLHKKQCIASIEDVQDRSYFYLKDFLPDRDILDMGLQEVEYIKEEFLEDARKQFKELKRKTEDLEEDYYNQLRKLREKERKS